MINAGRAALIIGIFVTATTFAPTIGAQEVSQCRPTTVGISDIQIENWLESVPAMADHAMGVPRTSADVERLTPLQLVLLESESPTGMEALDAIASQFGFDGFCAWLGFTYAVLEAQSASTEADAARGMMMVDERLDRNIAALAAHQTEVRRAVERLTTPAR